MIEEEDGADDVEKDDSDFHYPALPCSGYLSTYLYYVISEGYTGWVSGPTKNNGQTFVIKIPSK